MLKMRVGSAMVSSILYREVVSLTLEFPLIRVEQLGNFSHHTYDRRGLPTCAVVDWRAATSPR